MTEHKIVSIKKNCDHNWSFDGHLKTGSFICDACGNRFESEGVPDSFNVPNNILDMLAIEVMRHGQTCTALTCYEAINTITTLQSENTTLRSQVESLVAVVAAKDEAFQEVKRTIEDSDHWWMDEPSRGGFDKYKIDAAIALKPSDVELVEVGKVCFEDTLVGVDLTNANIKHGDKVYALQKKEGK